MPSFVECAGSGLAPSRGCLPEDLAGASHLSLASGAGDGQGGLGDGEEMLIGGLIEGLAEGLTEGLTDKMTEALTEGLTEALTEG